MMSSRIQPYFELAYLIRLQSNIGHASRTIGKYISLSQLPLGGKGVGTGDGGRGVAGQNPETAVVSYLLRSTDP